MTVAELLADLIKKYPRSGDQIEAFAPVYRQLLQHAEGARLSEAFMVFCTGPKSLFWPKPFEIAAHLPRGFKTGPRGAAHSPKADRVEELADEYVREFQTSSIGVAAFAEGWGILALSEVRRIASYQAQILATAEANQKTVLELGTYRHAEYYQLDALAKNNAITVTLDPDQIADWRWSAAHAAETSKAAGPLKPMDGVKPNRVPMKREEIPGDVDPGDPPTDVAPPVQSEADYGANPNGN